MCSDTMMLKFIFILGILALSDGTLSLSNRTNESVRGPVMKNVVDQLRFTLLNNITDKRKELLPKIEKLKEEAPKCKEKISSKMDACKLHIKDECKTSVGGVVEAYIEKGADYMEYPFVEFVIRKIWTDIGDYIYNKKHFLEFMSWWKYQKNYELFYWPPLDDYEDVLDEPNFFRKRSLGSSRSLEGNLWFGIYLPSTKKLYRRDIDQNAEKCMEQHEDCKPFLDTDSLFASICGDEFVKLNDTVNWTASALEVVYKRVMDSNDLILKNITYNSDIKDENWDLYMSLGYTEVYLTVKSADGYITYQTTKHYNPNRTPQSAVDFAQEYWEKYYQSPF